MIDRLAGVTILVDDQDDALAFYTEKLGFEKRRDEQIENGFRRVTVAPENQQDVEIVLQKPHPELHGEEGAQELMERIGESPMWRFHVDDCQDTFEELQERGVAFVQQPEEQPLGVEALFKDLYGNIFSILEPR